MTDVQRQPISTSRLKAKRTDYYGPVGVQGTNCWHVRTEDGYELRIRGQLSFTPCGTALIAFCDGERLLFGCRYTRWAKYFC
jgi:hypothetical protein